MLICSCSRGGKERRQPLRDFFLGYKQLQMEAGEQVKRIEFTEPAGHVRFNFEKVALREYLDIASVNTASQINHDLQQTITGGTRLANGLSQAASMIEQHEADAAHNLTSFAANA